MIPQGYPLWFATDGGDFGLVVGWLPGSRESTARYYPVVAWHGVGSVFAGDGVPGQFFASVAEVQDWLTR